MSEDFLSREASQFSPSGGGDFDFDRAASAFPDIEGIDGDIPPAPAAQRQLSQSNGFDFDSFDAPAAPARVVKVTEADDFDKFETEFPELEGEIAPVIPSAPAMNIFQSSISSTTPTFAPQPTQSSAISNAPVLSHTEEEDEPEVIKEWRQKQAESIRKRDEESEAKREEIIRKAERSIDQFYENYNATKEKNIKANKESEAAYVASLTEGLGEGTTWSRIAKHLELENSQSKTLARSGAGTSDLTRYKEVLLRLKREGENAPGAAGY